MAMGRYLHQDLQAVLLIILLRADLQEVIMIHYFIQWYMKGVLLWELIFILTEKVEADYLAIHKGEKNETLHKCTWNPSEKTTRN